MKMKTIAAFAAAMLLAGPAMAGNNFQGVPADGCCTPSSYGGGGASRADQKKAYNTYLARELQGAAKKGHKQAATPKDRTIMSFAKWKAKDQARLAAASQASKSGASKGFSTFGAGRGCSSRSSSC